MDELTKTKIASLDKIKEVNEQGIQPGNIEYLDKLVDIYKDLEEVEKMRYSEYGRGYRGDYGAYGEYGNYGENYGESYGRRGYDRKYKGHEYLERMSGDYGRYEEGRQRYGNNEDTKRSLKYMLESMEDFARMLKENAQNQEEVQMIRETAQRIASM